MEFSETEIKLFIVLLGDYFIIILSKFTFIIFQEREEKSNQATAPTVETKAKDVSVFFLIFTLLLQIKEHKLCLL